MDERFQQGGGAYLCSAANAWLLLGQTFLEVCCVQDGDQPDPEHGPPSCRILLGLLQAATVGGTGVGLRGDLAIFRKRVFEYCELNQFNADEFLEMIRTNLWVMTEAEMNDLKRVVIEFKGLHKRLTGEE